MELTIQDLIKGKSTLIKNKEYYPTRNYIEPFVEKMSKFTDDFRIKVKTPDQITLTKDSPDITFNRILIESVLPEKYSIDNHSEVIGLVYGLDIKKPVVKFYRGYLNQACLNMTIFNPSWLNIQELLPGEPINYNPISELMTMQNDFAIVINKMKNEYIDREQRKVHLGNWVDFTLREYEDYGYGKIKLSTSTAVDAYKQLFIDSSSNYFIPVGQDPTKFDIMNSFTQIITDDKRDILNHFEKTLLINRLLQVN